MGLFSKWGEYKQNRQQKRVESSLKYVKNPKAIREERVAAIQFFSEYEDPEVAVPALLSRFEYSLEHGINDTREKEQTMEGIVRHGEAAIEPLKSHLITTNRIAWTIKALKQVADESVLVDALKACLDFGDISFDEAKIEKNYDILCYLRDYQLPGYLDKLTHFLKSHDERVRYAAVEVILEQDDSRVPETVEQFIADTSSENTRIHQAVIDTFLEKGWPLKHPEKFEHGKVSDTIKVNQGGKLERS